MYEAYVARPVCDCAVAWTLALPESRADVQVTLAAANTFRSVAAEWIELNRGKWRETHATRVQF